MKKERASRAELNKDLRRILAKHHVDTAQVFFSASNFAVALSGFLFKADGSEFTSSSLSPLVEELMNQYGHIDSDLGNWDLTGGAIRKIEKDRTAHEEDEEFEYISFE